MADLNARIKPKKSSTAGEVPQASDLEVAELAVNTADGKLFVKHTDNSIKEISGGSGGGMANGRPVVNSLYKVESTTNTSPTQDGSIAAFSPNGSDTVVRYYNFDAYGNDFAGGAGASGTLIDVTVKINGVLTNLTGSTYSHAAQGTYWQFGVAGTGLFSLNDRVEFVTAQPSQQEGDIVKWDGAAFAGFSGSILELQDSAPKLSSVNNPYRTNVGPGLISPSGNGEFAIRAPGPSDTAVVRWWPQDADGSSFDDTWVGPAGSSFKGMRISGGGAVLDLAADVSANLVSQNGYLQVTFGQSGDYTAEEMAAWNAIAYASEVLIFPTPKITEAATAGDILVSDINGVFRPTQLQAVNSVNSQTGAVSLGVTDLDDYSAPTEYIFDTFQVTINPNEPGEYHFQQPGVSNNLAFAKEDANGAATEAIKNLSIGSTIYLNGVAFTTKSAGGTFSSSGSVGSWYIGITEDLSSVSTSGLTVTLEPPLSDGDVLQYSSTASAFKPAGASGLRSMLGIGEYADDTAADTGGLASGEIYYNTTSSSYVLKA